MRNRILNVVGTLAFAFNQWLQIILITRILGVSEVGLFSYFLAIVAPIVLFSRFSYSVLVPTQRKLNISYDLFYSFRIIFNYIFLIIVAVLTFILDFNIYESACLIVFGIFKFFETKEDYIYVENISESNIKFIAYSKILKSVITIVNFSIAIILFESLLLAIFSLVISQLIVYYFYDKKHLLMNEYDYKKFSYNHFKKIFLLGIGLTIVSVLTSLTTTFPRYILESFHGAAELGVYATIAYFAIISNNIVNAINQSVIAELSRLLVSSVKKFISFFMKLSLTYLSLIIVGLLILINFGESILVLMYGSHLFGYELEINLMGLQVSLLIFFKMFEMGLNIMNLYRTQVIIQSLTFVITIALSIILVIPYGIVGALLVSIFAYLLAILFQITFFILQIVKMK